MHTGNLFKKSESTEDGGVDGGTNFKKKLGEDSEKIF